MRNLVWHGTTEEVQALIAITERICDEVGNPCKQPGRGICGAHALLVESQERLDKLLAARRQREWWLRAERKR